MFFYVEIQGHCSRIGRNLHLWALARQSKSSLVDAQDRVPVGGSAQSIHLIIRSKSDCSGRVNR